MRLRSDRTIHFPFTVRGGGPGNLWISVPKHLAWVRGQRVSRLITFVIGIAIFGSVQAFAHDPITIDETVTIDGETITIVLEMKQNAVLFAINDVHSLFEDEAALTRRLPEITPYMTVRNTVTVDGAPIVMTFAGLGASSSSAHPSELPDPVVFRFEGKIPSGAKSLVITPTFFAEHKLTTTVLNMVHLTHGGKVLKDQIGSPGMTVTWDFFANTTGGEAGLEATRSAGSPLDFLRIGYLHILPEGLDHILFVLGLFLLSPKLKPLMVQVTAFTIAHSVTLGLSMAGLFSLPSRIVEPLIALSIAVVAIENIFYKEVKPWRWMVVFGFGLIHGLGFASALKDMKMPPGSILPPLISFNVGVELGQLSVIALAALVTVWFWKRPWYHRYIVIPASGMIACVGLFWAIQRALGFGIGP